MQLWALRSYSYVPPPLELTGNVSENWEKFRQRFQLYIDATAVSGKTEVQKTSLLLRVMRKPATEQDCLSQYHDVCKGLSKLLRVHRIVFDPDMQLVVHPARKVPFALHDQVKKNELNSMEDFCVITPVNKPTDCG